MFVIVYSEFQTLNYKVIADDFGSCFTSKDLSDTMEKPVMLYVGVCFFFRKFIKALT